MVLFYPSTGPHISSSAYLLRAGIIAIVAIVLHVQAHGQTHPIFNGIESACTGAFLDSGGQGAGGYGNNENYTYTLCPDVAGGAISLNFITFNLSLAGAAPVDGMTIHDGNSTAAPVLGTWTGSGLQGQVVSASSGNTSGCLTVVFHSNNTGTGSFAATISCYQPCIRPIAAAMYGSAGPMMICPGEAVTFNSSASTAAPGFSIASRTWDFGDGTILNNAPVTVSHTYTQPGAYTAQLYLLDNNGCSSTNLVDLVTLVGTTPNFNSMAGALGCGGETLCIDGAVNPTTWTETPDNGLGSGVFLPDNVGECFPTTLTFTQFAPGQTLTNVNQLLDICVNMEHSFMGDLIIRIISPNGQTVVLHQQGGGGTYLGVPVDNDATPNIQGTCWTYCWSPTATNGTWAANSGGTLPSGTYESVNPLSGLLGSPLNGTWTFEICDMWGIDNGFICDWSMEFDPALYPGLTQFTPLYGAACDSSFWTGPNITSTSADCNQFCTSGLPAGNHSFTYTVTDNFGCTYDTTVVVTIVPDLTVDAGPDQSTCGTAVQLNATCSSGGFPTSCEYELWLFDSFGDGWNANAYITVTIDGVSTNWTMPNGSAGFTTIQVPDGASIVLTYFRGGLFSNEQSFQLINSSGTVVYTGNNPPNGVVWTGTADCPDAGITYQWSPTTGLSDPSIANPTATVSTTSTYCVTAFPIGHPDCAMTDCMTITVDDPVDPGTNGSITVCANSAAFNLFTQLGGTPATGGTWTDPTGNAHGALFTPGTDPGGIYTYTVTGVGACGTSTASATVTVAVNTPPDAGTPGSITLCATDAPIDLFAQLGGSPDAGGAWSGPSPVVGGQFDPATMAPGVYTYTITVPPPCTNASSTVTVAVTAPPDAGADGALTLCVSSPAAALFSALGGTPDAGGTWSGPSTVSGGLFDPATMTPGTYTYTVAGNAPCPADAAVVSVSLVTTPDAGASTAIVLCSTTGPLDLFPSLGGADPSGSWTGPSGALFYGPFIPGTSPEGDYTYTVPGMPPCPSASAVISVNVVTEADAGDDWALALCSNAGSTVLFDELPGTPDIGGQWQAPDGSVFNGTFDAATDAPGLYMYVVTVPAPCISDTSVVQITVTQAVDAGEDGSTTLCTTSGVISLTDQLGGTPDEAGDWTGPMGAHSLVFDPSMDPAGIYTYTVLGTAPCPNATATVTITLNEMPDAGTDGQIALCPEADATDLFALLGGNPDNGGSWSGPGSTSHTGIFDPGTDPAGTYTYTVAGAAPCPADQAVAVVVVHQTPMPDAGPDLVSCTLSASLQAEGDWASGAWSTAGNALIATPGTAGTAVTAPAGGGHSFVWSVVSDEGCAGSDTVLVVFTSAIIPTVTVTDALCHGSCDGQAVATATGGNVLDGNYDFLWDLGNGPIMPVTIGLCAGSYTVTVSDTNGCATTVPFTIHEPEALEIDTVYATDETCPGSCDGSLLVLDPEGAEFSLDGLEFQTDSLITGLCPGSYTITMVNANGCSAQAIALVGSPPPVIAGFSVHPDTVFINEPVVTLANTSSANAATFHWDFGDGTTSTEESPAHAFPMGLPAEYEICLTAVTVDGCTDTYCTTLPVVDLPALFIPNAFTPDGDGRNDRFLVSGTSISPHGFSLLIFNRWGELIFESTDPAEGWDGTARGTPAKSEVYVWKLTAGFRGSIVKVEREGHVTLLR